MRTDLVAGTITIAALLVGVLCAPTACSADDKAVQLVEERQGDNIVVTAKLTNALDVTMTLNVDIQNLSPRPAAGEPVGDAGSGDVGDDQLDDLPF